MKKILASPRLFILIFLGFSSGLPLALVGSTLQAWFTQAGQSVVAVGALTLVGLPYVWKFVWAPIMDRFTLPWWGRRRGWIAITQIVLSGLLFILAGMDPNKEPGWIGMLALVIAFFSASQDIAIDAYRTDVLLPEERGPAIALYIFAYRVALLFAGGAALLLADYCGWQLTYQVMALLMALSVIATYAAPEISDNIESPKSFTAAVIDPFRDLLNRDAIIVLLLFIIFYKLGNALAQALLSNFLLRGLEFSLTEVGLAYKTTSLIATISGAFVGGILLLRLSMFRALMSFGLLQAFSNLMFMVLALAGKNYVVMVAAIFIENFCAGMSTAAFMAFLTGLCHMRYSATQYALFSAVSALGPVVVGPMAGVFVEHFGWINYYFWAFCMSFPGLILLALLRSKVFFHAKLAEA